MPTSCHLPATLCLGLPTPRLVEAAHGKAEAAAALLACMVMAIRKKCWHYHRSKQAARPGGSRALVSMRKPMLVCRPAAVLDVARRLLLVHAAQNSAAAHLACAASHRKFLFGMCKLRGEVVVLLVYGTSLSVFTVQYLDRVHAKMRDTHTRSPLL